MRSSLLAMGVLVSTFAAAAERDSTPCQVASPRVRLRNVRVRVGGTKPFDVSVDEAGVVARPRGVGSEVRVEAQLGFAGTIDSDELPYLLGAGARSTDEHIALGTVPWEATELRGLGDRFTARASLGNVSLEAIAWPCSALVLGETPRRASTLAPPPADLGAFTMFAVPKRVRLELAGTKYRVEISTSSAPLRARLLERRGERVRVALALDAYGATAEGWLPARVVSSDEPEHGLGDLGTIRKGGGGGCGGSAGPGGYAGPALVARDAEVFAAKGNGVWARARPVGSWSVVAPAGSEWVRILEVPGVSLDWNHLCNGPGFWLRRSDVTLGVSQQNGLTLGKASDGAPTIVSSVEPGSHWAAVGLRADDRIAKLRTLDATLLPLGALRSALACGGLVTLERAGKVVELAIPSSCGTSTNNISVRTERDEARY